MGNHCIAFSVKVLNVLLPTGIGAAGVIWLLASWVAGKKLILAAVTFSPTLQQQDTFPPSVLLIPIQGHTRRESAIAVHC